MSSLSPSEVERRIPSIRLIEDDNLWRETARLTADAPDYFWTVPASTSGYHHPRCRGERGLWAHTLMLSSVIERLAESRVALGELTEDEVDVARAAAILHDQRKNGDPASPSSSSVSDHDLRMADVVRSELDVDVLVRDAVADAIAAHMGPWYDGPEPETPVERLVHDADMIASTASITPELPEPVPDELADVVATDGGESR